MAIKYGTSYFPSLAHAQRYYSCSDFTDDILNALKIDVPEEAYDSPWAQADLALSAIDAMQCELAARRVGWTFEESANEFRLNDFEQRPETIDANKTWRELCDFHKIGVA
jgi:hypothetical protein